MDKGRDCPVMPRWKKLSSCAVPRAGIARRYCTWKMCKHGALSWQQGRSRVGGGSPDPVPGLRVNRHRLNGGWPQLGPGEDDLLVSPVKREEEIGSRLTRGTAAGIRFPAKCRRKRLVNCTHLDGSARGVLRWRGSGVIGEGVTGSALSNGTTPSDGAVPGPEILALGKV